MAITFAVDDVTPASSPPRSTPVTHKVGDVLALGVDPSLPVVDAPRTHALLGAVHVAFAEHRPLALSPDAIWLTIAEGLARHVRLEAHALRDRLVRHDAARTGATPRLVVRHDGPFPHDPVEIASLVGRMRQALAAEVGEGATRLFVCDFSTTTDVERTASEIVLLDAYSPFYDYGVECVCGIPSITLTGTLEDWRALRARIDALGDLTSDTGLPNWHLHLGTIADELVKAAAGAPNRAFFQRIYKPKKAYGADRVTGWIGWLYPYLGGGGRYDVVNPLLAHAPDRPLPGEERHDPDAHPGWWAGPGLRPRDVPSELGRAQFRVVDHARHERFDVTLSGGLGVVSVDPSGAITARALWWCEPGAPSVDELAERLGRSAAPGATPRASGIAELDSLLRETGPISIHDDLVRSLPEALTVSFERHVLGFAHFRLREGDLLVVIPGASTATGRAVWVRVPERSLAERRHGTRPCTLPLVELPVVGDSLTRVLSECLETGSLPPSHGVLYDRVAPSLRLPHLEEEPSAPLVPAEHVPLAPRTTLELGGSARYLVSARCVAEITQALAWAERERLPVFVLGGGSNLIVPDEGHPGLVLAISSRGVATMAALDARGERRIRVTAAAGEPWDDFVALTVSHGWQGLECLSGIPGLVGSTPVQNVGAYGQDVSESIVAVGVIDRATRLARTLTPEECQFAYRDSALKRDPTRYVVTWVCFELRPGGAPSLEYAELQKALAHRGSPSLAEVRETVIALRRTKSMVLDAFDPNRRSAGSFFTNPIVSGALAEEVVARAIERGLVTSAAEVPRWPQKDGRVKLAAGWLIERSGIVKGLRRGNVGVSSAHALALVHHGGGTTAELLALAEHVKERVRETFGVELEREPVLLG